MEVLAVDRIANLAVEAAKANRIETPEPAILINDRVVSIEHLQATRSRLRGTFKTTSLAAFCDYTKTHALGDESQAFVDGKNLRAVSIINLGNILAPGHADWRAVLDVERSAEFQAVLDANGKRMTQREMSEFIEDWGFMLSGHAGEEPQTVAQMAAAIRSLKISTKGESASDHRDFGATKSAFEEVEASSKAGVLPGIVRAFLRPADGFRHRQINMRLSVITGEKPALVLRIVALEKENADIGDEFAQLLTDQIGDACKVIAGSFTA